MPQSNSDAPTLIVLAHNETDRYFRKETIDPSDARSGFITEHVEEAPAGNYVEQIKTVTFNSIENGADSIMMNSLDLPH